MSEDMTYKVFVMIIPAIIYFFRFKTIFPNKSYIIIALGAVAIFVLICAAIMIGMAIAVSKCEKEMEEKRKHPITMRELRELIASFVHKPVDEVGNDDDFKESLGLNIFEHCELLEKIGNETGVEMYEDIACGIFTINEMVAYLRENGKEVIE